MAIFKDIETYTQKSVVAGTEKIPVSDTEFITPEQIANSGDLKVVQSDTDLAFSDENGYCVAVFYNGHIKTKNFDSADIREWAKAATKPTYTASEVGALPNTTSIPSALSDLSEDTTHRVVTDTEKSTWNAKQNAITVSSSEPTSSQGSDGDIWIVI